MVEEVDYSEWTKRQTWTASNGVTLKISASDLPNISNSTVKRTSFPNSDPVFLDYQSKVNYLSEQESCGSGLGLYADNVGVSLMYSNVHEECG